MFRMRGLWGMLSIQLCDNCWTNTSFVFKSCYYAGPPPAPSGYIISFGEAAGTTATLSFSFTWDSTFNSHYAITSYKVVPTNNGGSFMVECPSFCPPDVPCRCIGLRVGDQMKVNISAINCDLQVGQTIMVSVASCKFRQESGRS